MDGNRAEDTRNRQSGVGAQPAGIGGPGRWRVFAGYTDLECKPLVQAINWPVAAVRYARARAREVTGGLHVLEACRAEIFARALERIGRGLFPLKGQNGNCAE